MLTVVVGLPGSGKTYHALTEALKDHRLLIYDDCLGSISGVRANFDRLAHAIRSGTPVEVNDALLCLDAHRAAFRGHFGPHLGPPHREARWLFFANSPDMCRANVEKRYRVEMSRLPEGADRRRRVALSLIDELAPAYRIPGDAEVLEVFDYSRRDPSG